MVRIQPTGITFIYFYSPDLNKGQNYSNSTLEFYDPYTRDTISPAGSYLFQASTYRHRVAIPQQQVVGMNLVENRKYDFVLKLQDGTIIYRDSAIYTSQDISHETPHEFAYNHDQYKYLNRGSTLNEYKTLTR